MDADKLAAAIVDKILGISDESERTTLTIHIRGPNRSAIIRPSHMVRDAIQVILEEVGDDCFAAK